MATVCGLIRHGSAGVRANRMQFGRARVARWSRGDHGQRGLNRVAGQPRRDQAACGEQLKGVMEARRRWEGTNP